MVQTVHPFFNPAQAAAFSELATKRDSSFELRYFGLHGFGAICRNLLAIGGASVKNVVPTEWAVEKPDTPFGVMPLLKEISADGKTTINIAESSTIENYIAKKYGMFGDNVFEETVIDSFSNNTHGIMIQIIFKYLMAKDPVLKEEVKNQLLTGSIASWIKLHEQHLAANGSNGHYVGNKVSIADVRTAYMVGVVNSIKEDTITEENAPSIMKVKATVDSIPSFKAWRETEEFKAFSEKNLQVLGFP